MANEFEAQRLTESAAKWRTLAWIITVVGFIGIAIISYYGASAEDYWNGGRRFSAGAFFLNLFVYSVAFLALIWPYFMITQLMNGLSAAIAGRGGGSWMRDRAGSWRAAAWGLTLLGGLGAGLVAYAISEGGAALGAWENSTAPFFLVFVVIFLAWMLEVWPFYMICRSMEGTAVLMGDPGGFGDASPAFATGAAVAPSGLPAPSGAWQATHRVPDGGLAARQQPDPALPILMRIRAGVPLAAIRRSGEWALVRTDQGWQAWVDGRRLVPVAPDNAPQPPEEPPAPPNALE